MKRALIALAVFAVVPALAQQYQYEGLKTGMTLEEAKRALLIHYSEEQIACLDAHRCIAYETAAHLPVRGYRGDLTAVPNVSVNFGDTSNRVYDITARDPITPFGVFRAAAIRAHGDPNKVLDDGNDLWWQSRTGEWMEVSQHGGSCWLTIHSKNHRR